MTRCWERKGEDEKEQEEGEKEDEIEEEEKEEAQKIASLAADRFPILYNP